MKNIKIVKQTEKRILELFQGLQRVTFLALF